MRTASLLTISLSAIVLFLAGCESELDDKPAAVVDEASAEETPESPSDEAQQESQELTFDTESSSIEWVGAKVTRDHHGGFEDWTGTATVRGERVEQLDFTVDTRSIFSDDPELTEHLRTEDFFAVEEYPEASFSSSRIVEHDGDEATHRVSGAFTIRGVTNNVTFPATIEFDGDQVRGSAEFTIDRFDYDIDYPGMADNLIEDKVLLQIDLTAV